jgi:hypothetical protein
MKFEKEVDDFMNLPVKTGDKAVFSNGYGPCVNSDGMLS